MLEDNSKCPPQKNNKTVSRDTYEIHANSRDVAFCVGVIGKSKEQTRLSNARISDKEEFEEVIVSIHVVRTRQSRLLGLSRGTVAYGMGVEHSEF